jgi:phytanoyl-CoA hydroxylase
MPAAMTTITGQESELKDPYTPPKALKNNIGDALDESNFGWLKETVATASIEEMRSNFLRDGYLFVKNLLPRKEVLEVREECVKYSVTCSSHYHNDTP